VKTIVIAGQANRKSADGLVLELETADDREFKIRYRARLGGCTSFLGRPFTLVRFHKTCLLVSYVRCIPWAECDNRIRWV
jgi:hypothetical protein